MSKLCLFILMEEEFIILLPVLYILKKKVLSRRQRKYHSIESKTYKETQIFSLILISTVV